MVPMDNGPANTGPWQVDHFLQTTIQAESLKAITRPVRDQQALPASPPVKADPVGIVQVHISFPPAPEIIFQVAGFVIMHDILSPITICDKYIPVLVDGCFRGDELLRLLINARIKGGVDSEEYFAIHGRLI